MQEQIFGWLSIVLCVLGFGMQIHKLVFRKNIKSISIFTFSITVCGSMFWSIHSLFATAFHGGFENSIITFSSGIILFCSLRGKVSQLSRTLMASIICGVALTLASMLLANYIKPGTIVFPHSVVVEMLTGCLAGTLMSISFIPQVLKVFRTKDAKDVSTFMCVFYGAAQVVLIIYWASRSDYCEIGQWLPGVIFCSCVLTMQSSLLSLKMFIERPKFLLSKKTK